MRKLALLGALPLLAFPSLAFAQQQGGTLPPLPGEPATQPAPGQPATQPAPAQQTAPPQGYAQQQPPPPVYYQQPVPPPPPAIEYTPPPEPTHAPKFSLYAGASLRYMGFGGYFYENQRGEGETTGNFLGNGPAVELDVGARLGKRYIPFLLYEHGFTSQGHRFAGSDATSSSDLLGVGFRAVSGDVDNAGFLGEIAVGVRSIKVTQGSETYKMSALEIFRLGLGAEIRLATLFSLSPMAHISGGVMNDTEGTVHFSPDGSRDGISPNTPTYVNGQNIQNQRGYVMIAIGCGGHFDIFGK